MVSQDRGAALQAQVQEAIDARQPLRIRGGGSKDFLGREPQGAPVDLAEHTGIVSYEPTELVVTVRAGTRLAELEQVLAEQGQRLPFEPPGFGPQATIGGTIACNLSGPARPYAGAARDALLGVKLLNGKGEILRFGGEVMKNVAGYDVSRLMAGAMGTLGLLLEVSLKVLPRPEHQITLVLAGQPVTAALARLHRLARQPLPITAAAYFGDQLRIRLGGTESGLAAAQARIPGEPLATEEAEAFWQDLKNHQLPFFADERPLWRLSVPANLPPLSLDGEWLYDWGGAQRWVHSEASPETLFELARQAGGHAMAFRDATQRERVFQPLAPGIARLNQRLKQAFDPHGLLNPGRLYVAMRTDS